MLERYIPQMFITFRLYIILLFFFFFKIFLALETYTWERQMMAMRKVVSEHEVECNAMMQIDNCQDVSVSPFSSSTRNGGADSERLWRKFAGKVFNKSLSLYVT